MVQKSGSWYSRGEERLGQGREAARAYLKDHPDVAGALEVSLREKLGLMPGSETEED